MFSKIFIFAMCVSRYINKFIFFFVIFVNKIHNNSSYPSYSANVRRKPTIRNFIPQPISRPLFNSTLIHTPTQVSDKTSPLLLVTRQISISLRTATSICLKETRARRGLSRDSWRRRRSWRTDKYSLRATVDLLPGLPVFFSLWATPLDTP